MNCPNCGLAAQETDKFCIGCGAPLRKPEPEVPSPIEIPEAAPIEEAVNEAAALPQEAANELTDAVAEAEQVFAPEPVLKAEPVIETPVIETPVVETPVVPAAPVAPVVPVAPVEQVKPVQPEPVKPVQPEPVKPAAPVKPEQPVRSKLDKPLSTWGYIWRIILFAIPVLGIIPMFVMAFSKGINKNSKHFASAILILLLIAFVLAIAGVIYLFCTHDPATINDMISNFINNFKVS